MLVNDPAQDYANEQNSQFETTIAVVGSNVIVAYVDSNRGVYGLGQIPWIINYTPRLTGYCVSTNGGVTFNDLDVPPLDLAGYGDAGDPVLAVDRASPGVVYLVGTSPRQNAAFRGVPLWKSTNSGLSFIRQATVQEGITNSDKPWIAVDDFTGTGQHDVYIACRGQFGGSNGVWVTVSTDGYGTNWSGAPIPVSDSAAIDPTSPIVVIDPNHVAYITWLERRDSTNFLKMRTATNRASALGSEQTVRQLAATNLSNGMLGLKRGNTYANDDVFTALPFPVVAANPSTNKAGHLYVAYADTGTNSGDKADIFFVASTDGGVNWTNPVRVNTVWTNGSVLARR